MSVFNKIKEFFKVNWIKTLYFNFHYLPFKQAKKLPILLYKCSLQNCKGTVKIESEEVFFGMIKLGRYIVSLYPNTGIVWENHGGVVVFKGKCLIGNNSFISIACSGKIDIGNDFVATSSLKITSYCLITFSEHVRVAWETIIMDTAFHNLKDMNGNIKGKAFSPIFIGKNNWISIRCIVLKGAKTPDFCVFGVGSIINKDYSEYPNYILLAGNPLEVKKNGIWRDTLDDDIVYSSIK